MGEDSLLFFSLGKRNLAIETRHVEKVIEGRNIYPLIPLLPYIKGFISYRRYLIPLLNGSHLFKTERGGRNLILLSSELGLIALECEEILSIDTPTSILPVDRPFIKGMVERSGKIHWIVDLPSLLAEISKAFEG